MDNAIIIISVILILIRFKRYFVQHGCYLNSLFGSAFPVLVTIPLRYNPHLISLATINVAPASFIGR